MLELFYNSKGEFQWVSITVFMSLFSVIINVFSVISNSNHQKKNRVNQSIINTRIQYLNMLNEQLTEIYSGIVKMRLFLLKSEEGYANTNMKNDALYRKEKVLEDIFKLNIYKNPDNIACEQLDICIGILVQRTQTMLDKYNNGESIKDLYHETTKLMELMSIGVESYNEEEWKLIHKLL